MKQSGHDSGNTAVSVKCDLASDVLRSFGSLRFAATGWSMLPSIWPGDTLVVDRIAAHQVHIGDVVLVGREGRLCAHRVVNRAVKEARPGNPQWITQGDAMSAPDQPVTQSELLGRVSYVIRSGKLIAVPAQLSMAERLTAMIIRHSVPAARALVFLHRIAHTPEKSAPEESVPCQG
jgi:hypothetical protein